MAHQQPRRADVERYGRYVKLLMAQLLATLGFWLIRLARTIGHHSDEAVPDDPFSMSLVVSGDDAIKDEDSTIHFNRKRPWQ